MSHISFFKSKYCTMSLRCCGAVFTGVAVIGTLVIGLSLLGGRDDVPSAHLARTRMTFPENQKMLDRLSEQLMHDAHISPAQEQGATPHQDKTLSAIQPAAGGVAHGQTDQ